MGSPDSPKLSTATDVTEAPDSLSAPKEGDSHKVVLYLSNSQRAIVLAALSIPGIAVLGTAVAAFDYHILMPQRMERLRLETVRRREEAMRPIQKITREEMEALLAKFDTARQSIGQNPLPTTLQAVPAGEGRILPRGAGDRPDDVGLATKN